MTSGTQNIDDLVRRVFPADANKRDPAVLVHAIEALVDITLSTWRAGVHLPDRYQHLQELDTLCLQWQQSVPLLARDIVRNAYMRRRAELAEAIGEAIATDDDIDAWSQA